MYDTSSQAYLFDNNVPNRSPLKKTTQHLQLESRGPGAEKKVLLGNKSQAGVMSSRYQKQLSLSTMTFLLVGSM